jgi:hypothetical protein
VTEYVILRFGGAANWTLVERVEARSANDAIRDLAEESAPEEAQVFVAVPSRHWKPQKVTVENKPFVTFKAMDKAAK